MAKRYRPLPSLRAAEFASIRPSFGASKSWGQSHARDLRRLSSRGARDFHEQRARVEVPHGDRAFGSCGFREDDCFYCPAGPRGESAGSADKNARETAVIGDENARDQITAARTSADAVTGKASPLMAENCPVSWSYWKMYPVSILYTQP